MNNEIIIEALRKARIYIRSVEAWRGTIDDPLDFDVLLNEWTEGGEITDIDRALAEFGMIV